MVYPSSRYETPQSQFNTLTLWGRFVVRPRIHLISRLFLSAFSPSCLLAWVAHFESRAKKSSMILLVRLVLPGGHALQGYTVWVPATTVHAVQSTTHRSAGLFQVPGTHQGHNERGQKPGTIFGVQCRTGFSAIKSETWSFKLRNLPHLSVPAMHPVLRMHDDQHAIIVWRSSKKVSS